MRIQLFASDGKELHYRVIGLSKKKVVMYKRGDINEQLL